MERIAPECLLISAAYVLQRVAAREQWIAARHLSSDPEQTGRILAVLGGRHLYRKAEPGMVVGHGGDARPPAHHLLDHLVGVGVEAYSTHARLLQIPHHFLDHVANTPGHRGMVRPLATLFELVCYYSVD